MCGLIDFYKSTVGKKICMALSGLVLVGFVVSHMAGNLKIFAGVNPQSGLYKFDEYAAYLRQIGEHMLGHGGALWVARLVLLVCVVVHMVSGIQLACLNRRAKPIKVNSPLYSSSNAASRSMAFGGLFLLVFIVFHVLHLTTGQLHFNGFVEGKVYSNVVKAFQNPALAGFYVVAMLFLCLHLYHGIWSMFQTLGVDSPAWNSGIRTVAKLVSLLLFIGFSAVPLSVLFGLLSLSR